MVDLSSVTTTEVLAGATTALPTATVEALIEEAAILVAGELETVCGIDPDTLATFPRALRIAVINATRHLIFERDASSGLRYASIQEGGERITFAGTSSKDVDALMDDVRRLVSQFCKANSSRYLPSMKVHDRPIPRLDDRAVAFGDSTVVDY